MQYANSFAKQHMLLEKLKSSVLRKIVNVNTE